MDPLNLQPFLDFMDFAATEIEFLEQRGEKDHAASIWLHPQNVGLNGDDHSSNMVGGDPHGDHHSSPPAEDERVGYSQVSQASSGPGPANHEIL